jgi:pimeloyl-ACP methyl ester carboxylesterase
MASLAEPLVQAMHAFGLAGATLVGNCAGAIVALEAARLGAPVRRLVLVDPFAFVPWYFGLLTRGWLGRLFYRLTFANPLGRWIGKVVLGSKRSDSTDLFGGFSTVRHADTWSFLHLLCTEPRIDRYAELEVPIDVVHGERTFRAVMRSAETFRMTWPNRCRVFTVAGAGHLPIQEAPRAIAEIGFSPRRHS